MDDLRLHPGALLAKAAGKLGHRVALGCLWSAADWGSSTTGEHVLVWQTAKTNGDKSGSDTRTAKRRIAGLAAAGFVVAVSDLDQAARDEIGLVVVRARGADGEAIFDKFGAPVFTRMTIKCMCGKPIVRCHCRVLAPITEAGELISSLERYQPEGGTDGSLTVSSVPPPDENESGSDGNLRVVQMANEGGTDGNLTVSSVPPHLTTTEQDQTKLTKHTDTKPTARHEGGGQTREHETPGLSDSRAGDPKGTESTADDAGRTREMFTLDPEPAARRDCAAEVFEILRTRVIATKQDLGIKPAVGPRKLHASDRKAIEARISEHGGGDDGVEACRRVIAIDEAECRSQGPGGKGWSYWDAKTPFRPSNFESRIGRWRADGDHALMSRPRSSNQRRHVSGHNLDEEFPCDG